MIPSPKVVLSEPIAASARRISGRAPLGRSLRLACLREPAIDFGRERDTNNEADHPPGRHLETIGTSSTWRMKTILALLVVLLAPTALAGPELPPCTCDPNPITELLRCSLSEGSAPPPGCEDPIGVPGLPDPKDVDLGGLDPRNWPCTCDPGPELS